MPNNKKLKENSHGYAIITDNLIKGKGINNHIFKCRKTKDIMENFKNSSKKHAKYLDYDSLMNIINIIDVVVDKQCECYLKDAKSECSNVEPEKNEFKGLRRHICNISGLFNLKLVFYSKVGQNNKGDIYLIFYTEDRESMMILSALIGKTVCGNCVSTLYNINKK